MILSSTQKLSEVENSIFGAAHTRQISVFGQEGYEIFKSSQPGRKFDPEYGHYLKIENEEKSIKISTDHFGLFKLYMYRSEKNWAISDSIYDLVKFAQTVGEKVTPYPPSAYAFLAKHGVGQQLSSYQTTFREIKLIPHWNDIVVDADGVHFIGKPCVKWHSDLGNAILEAGAFFGSLTRSYIKHGLDPFILLSGGLDSRCTAVAMTAGLSKDEKAKIQSYTMQAGRFSQERDIAISLSNEMDISPLSQAKPQRQPNWQEWKRSFLGDHTLLLPYSRFTPPDIAFGGSCAENIKPFYAWDNGVDDISFPDHVPDHIKETVYRDIRSSMSSFAGGFSEKLSDDDKHYQMFRNRFHFGNDVRDSIFNFAPFVFSVIKTRTSPQDTSGMYRLLFELGGPKILHHPFDDESKSFKSDIPSEWRDNVRESLILYDREVFFKVPNTKKYMDLTGGSRNDSGAQTGRALVSPDMLEDCKAAISFVSDKKILDEQYVSRARTQMNHLANKGQSALPYLCPELMGVLSISMGSVARI